MEEYKDLRREKMRLAMFCFDGDPLKAMSLLKLLEVDPYESKMPDVVMEIPPEDD